MFDTNNNSLVFLNNNGITKEIAVKAQNSFYEINYTNLKKNELEMKYRQNERKNEISQSYLELFKAKRTEKFDYSHMKNSDLSLNQIKSANNLLGRLNQDKPKMLGLLEDTSLIEPAKTTDLAIEQENHKDNGKKIEKEDSKNMPFKQISKNSSNKRISKYVYNDYSYTKNKKKPKMVLLKNSDNINNKENRQL